MQKYIRAKAKKEKVSLIKKAHTEKQKDPEEFFKISEQSYFEEYDGLVPIPTEENVFKPIPSTPSPHVFVY